MKKIGLVLMTVIFAVFCISQVAFSASAAGVVYVSASGSDDAAGTSDAPVATLSRAYALLGQSGEIIITDSATYVEAPKHSGTFTIKGSSASATLDLSSNGGISLKGDMTFDNLVFTGGGDIFANGYKLYIGNGVTSPNNRRSAFGGKDGVDLTGDTDITVLGGQYWFVCGGGRDAAVNGSTYITVGGNVNEGEPIEHETNNYTFLGGGLRGTVTGSTNLTLEGNAIAEYVAGAGSGTNGICANTNIFIKGGNVMNVYGGCSSNLALPDGTVTNITMTAGTVEAIFGGSSAVNFTGHTNITLLGGTVTRRVFTGCYNNTSGLFTQTFDTDCYVIGTTTLAIGPNVTLVTSSDDNSGVFAGSRTKNSHDDEINTLIFLDGCYSAQSGKIGDKSGWSSTFKSFEDYTVKASAGGAVYGINEAGKVVVSPDKGYYATAGSAKYVNEAEVTLSTGTNTVTFTYDETLETNTPEMLGLQVRIPVEGGDTYIKQGLRYVSRIPIETYNMLEEQGILPDSNSDTGLGFGTVMLPASMLNGEKLTKTTASAAVVPAVNIFKTTSTHVWFTVCLVDIVQTKYDYDYVAVPYVTYTYDGQEVTLYGEQLSASVYDVAVLAAADDSSETETVKDYLKKNIIDYVEGWIDHIYKP